MAKEKDKEIDKDKMLDQVLADIEKQFGKGAIMKYSFNWFIIFRYSVRRRRISKR